jgi:hypothetical protein
MDTTRSAATYHEDANPNGYRQVVADALEQLDWCIGYLHGIGRTKVANVLAHNRSVIRSQIIRRPAEPLLSERRSDAPSDGAKTPPRSKHATGSRTRRSRPRTRTAAGHR